MEHPYPAGHGRGVLKTAPFAVDTFGPCVSKLRCAKCKHAHHPFSALCPPSFAESAESKLHQRAMLPKKGLHRAKERACTGPAQQTCSGSMQHRMDERSLHHHRWSIHTQQGMGGGSSKLHHSQSIHLDHVSPSSDVQSASMRTILFQHCAHQVCRVGRIQAAPKSNVAEEGPAQGQRKGLHRASTTDLLRVNAA